MANVLITIRIWYFVMSSLDFQPSISTKTTTYIKPYTQVNVPGMMLLTHFTFVLLHNWIQNDFEELHSLSVDHSLFYNTSQLRK